MAEQDAENKERWLPPVEDWGRVDDKAYEIMLALAKERFEESATDSQEITSRAQRLLIGITSLLAASIGIIGKTNLSLGTIAVLAILYGIDLFMLVLLLRPKTIPPRGSRPSEAFPENLDDRNTCNAHEQVKKVYARLLVLYEEKIAMLKEVNGKRAKRYEEALVFSIVLFVGTVIYLVCTISPPS